MKTHAAEIQVSDPCTITREHVARACRALHDLPLACLPGAALEIVDGLYPEASEESKAETARLYHLRELVRRRREAVEG